jgi:hypothetical protein
LGVAPLRARPSPGDSKATTFGRPGTAVGPSQRSGTGTTTRPQPPFCILLSLFPPFSYLFSISSITAVHTVSPAPCLRRPPASEAGKQPEPPLPGLRQGATLADPVRESTSTPLLPTSRLSARRGHRLRTAAGRWKILLMPPGDERLFPLPHSGLFLFASCKSLRSLTLTSLSPI